MSNLVRQAGREGRQPISSRIFALSVQWDETSQKFEHLLKAMHKGTKHSSMQKRSELMVISGNVHLAMAEGSGQDRRWPCTSEAWRVKPKRLEHTSADFLLEALLSAMPIDFRKPADIKPTITIVSSFPLLWTERAAICSVAYGSAVGLTASSSNRRLFFIQSCTTCTGQLW